MSRAVDNLNVKIALHSVPIGDKIYDGDHDQWVRVDDGYVLLEDGRKTGGTVAINDMVDWDYGPFALPIISAEPTIATLDDVKPGAVISFTYTYTVNKPGEYSGLGYVDADTMTDWVRHPKNNSIAHVVTPAPNPVDAKIAEIYEYAKSVDYGINDSQARFLAGYLLSLENK